MSFIFFLFNFFISFHYIIIFLSRDFTYLGMADLDIEGEMIDN
jgi:hypothetical protein